MSGSCHTRPVKAKIGGLILGASWPVSVMGLAFTRFKGFKNQERQLLSKGSNWDCFWTLPLCVIYMPMHMNTHAHNAHIQMYNKTKRWVYEEKVNSTFNGWKFRLCRFSTAYSWNAQEVGRHICKVELLLSLSLSLRRSFHYAKIK